MGFTDTRFNVTQYMAKRVVFTFGGAFRIFDNSGNLLFYSRQKLFKLREDIRVFDGADMQQEILSIKARQIIDFSAAYDVIDSATQEKVGALRRRGFKSMFKDHWEILDRHDTLFATIKEDSMAMALLRRYLLNIIPQTYLIETVSGQEIGTIRQRFNPFVHTFNVNFSADQGEALDRRVGVAAVILLLAIEGRQG